MIFAKADTRDSTSIKHAFGYFSGISGLTMNPVKSSLYVGRQADSIDVADCLDVRVSDLPSTYLGLPFFSGRLTKEMYAPLVSKFKRKLDTWKANTLSMAGGLELLTSTLSDFSLFWSVAFPLPSSFVNEIDKGCRSFVWGDPDNKRKIHTILRKIICSPKAEGGFGVKDTKVLEKTGSIMNL